MDYDTTYDNDKRIKYSTDIKAALVVMASENELMDVHMTMQDVEDRFNQYHGYPWVILSDRPFSSRFRRLLSKRRKNVYFGRIPPGQWNEPTWVDVKSAEKAALAMGKDGMYHGESVSWRKATRYNAGYLAQHPLLQDAEYYWKVQPRSRYMCDVKEDPFQMMKEKDQKLAFAMTMKEDERQIRTFWSEVVKYIGQENVDSFVPHSDSILPWILDTGAQTDDDDMEPPTVKYNGNHFWNNFMIISLDFMRSEPYQRFFQHMDSTGGFFYERWGDAPFQTVAAALYLQRNQVHFVENLGYWFNVALQCPSDVVAHQELRCTCASEASFLNRPESRTKELLQLQQQQQQQSNRD
ncbi:nucleotide-diphospho-sugar transferase [Zychaea mexicana]|uniref:nucleotide-diphospho-sugar transferase n=1 Tax=Zychaea mexicana TaxID=64656 RepID=UPI0022FE5E91|nr:nucleotide-diphospho-sugar transferase [Zychaea mexicana]KAI9492069.1 nucleotide-diphospho-sugar transferase [Zychaea mexicana]